MLKVTHLRKEFDTVVAVDDVSFDVQRGELFGLLGPNGAGKTTTIRTVLNILRPDSGTISFDGKPFSASTWNSIGYLPEERGLYRKSKVVSTLLYFASLKGLSRGEAKPRAIRWLERFGLADRANSKVEELSKGNQQKVQLIVSLLHNPSLLILDEPFSGLDPVNQLLLKDIMMELRKQNIAIVFSTHQMEQVEKLCDNICLINKGKLVLNGALRDIKKQYGKNSVHLEFEGDGRFLKSLPIVRRADIYENYAELELVHPEQTGEILSHINGKLALRKFEVVEPSLNSIFISIVGPPPEVPAEQRPEMMGGVRQSVAKDPKVRKALTSVLIVGVLALAFTFASLTLQDPPWGVIAALYAALGILLFRYVGIWRKVMSGAGTREIRR